MEQMGVDLLVVAGVEHTGTFVVLGLADTIQNKHRKDIIVI